VRGMAHITGGGITENLPRVFPAGCAAEVDRSRWPTPPLFAFLQKQGRIETDEMFRAFNMGIGLIVICARGCEEQAVDLLKQAGEMGAILIGRVVAGDGDVQYL